MSARKPRIWAALAVAAGFIVDMAYGHAMRVGPMRADLGFVCLMVSCLYLGANAGGALGLTLGLLQASYGAAYAGSTLVSRAVAGWGIGALDETLFRDSAPVAVALSFAGTLLCETAFYACAPQADVHAFASHGFWTACGNGILALPVYAVLRRVLARPTDEAGYSR